MGRPVFDPDRALGALRDWEGGPIFGGAGEEIRGAMERLPPKRRSPSMMLGIPLKKGTYFERVMSKEPDISRIMAELLPEGEELVRTRGPLDAGDLLRVWDGNERDVVLERIRQAMSRRRDRPFLKTVLKGIEGMIFRRLGIRGRIPWT